MSDTARMFSAKNHTSASQSEAPHEVRIAELIVSL